MTLKPTYQVAPKTGLNLDSSPSLPSTRKQSTSALASQSDHRHCRLSSRHRRIGRRSCGGSHRNGVLALCLLCIINVIFEPLIFFLCTLRLLREAPSPLYPLHTHCLSPPIFTIIVVFEGSLLVLYAQN
uniref:Uncharacterized protein n=1 Tax=Opuntia streptacantha TaxID=393608 RepID=A0A7C8YG07_OPUST